MAELRVCKWARSERGPQRRRRQHQPRPRVSQTVKPQCVSVCVCVCFSMHIYSGFTLLVYTFYANRLGKKDQKTVVLKFRYLQTGWRCCVTDCLNELMVHSSRIRCCIALLSAKDRNTTPESRKNYSLVEICLYLLWRNINYDLISAAF